MTIMNQVSFDPRNWGAKFDGITDDLSALQAMHADLPSAGATINWPFGMAWLSDTWHISKPVHLIGLGGNGEEYSGIQCPAGRTAMTIDHNHAGITTTGEQHIISQLDLRSKILIHPSATGNALGRGLAEYSPLGPVRVGEV